MAVMTSQHPDTVTFDQKTAPVPSSEKMALDLEINGISNHDESNLETSSPDLTFNKTQAISPPAEPEVDANGMKQNLDAFASNQVAGAVDGAMDSQPTYISPTSDLNSSQLPDTNTTTSDSTSAEVPQVQSSSLLASANSAIDSAVEDIAASSTVPPVVEAQESDLRDTASSLELAQPMEPPAEQPLEQSLGFELDIQPDEVSSSVFESEMALDPQPGDLTFAAEPLVAESALPLPETALDPSPSIANEPIAALESEQLPASETQAESKDTAMADTPQPSPPTKVARPREEDDEIEPSAKRTKTEDDEQAIPDVPQTNMNGEASASTPDAPPLTPFQAKEVAKIFKNASRTQAGGTFGKPVVEAWPALAESYTAKITNPIDLRTMEQKLKDGHYPTMESVKADVHLLHDNARLFNGDDHSVTRQAAAFRDSLLHKLSNLPSEPAPVIKKEKKEKKVTPVPDGPRNAGRRQSRGAHSGPPNVAAPVQQFALNPVTNTPLIRRDSTKVDGGRPKREIHPPRPKDLPYSQPKTKKHAVELKFCKEVLNEINKSKYAAFTSVFALPVDPVALNVPNYFTVVKKPMDLSTVKGRLDGGSYATAADFEKDFRLIIAACYKFNPGSNIVHKMGNQLEQLFNEQWERKDKWISEHTPAAASPEGTPESEGEESEDEEPEPSTVTQSEAMLRLVEEQTKLINMMGAKNTNPASLELQQALVATVKKHVDEETAAKTKSRKPKTKTAKKAAPPKKAAGGNKKGGHSKAKYMGTLEKETISAGIGALPENICAEVLGMIKAEQPNVGADDDGTVELDIDLITVPTLWKIHQLIMRHAPEVEVMVRKSMQERESPRSVAKPPPKKKNKPMSKLEQENKIQKLQAKALEFERQSSNSQEPPIPTVENQDSSEDDSSDSEEE